MYGKDFWLCMCDIWSICWVYINSGEWFVYAEGCWCNGGNCCRYGGRGLLWVRLQLQLSSEHWSVWYSSGSFVSWRKMWIENSKIASDYSTVAASALIFNFHTAVEPSTSCFSSRIMCNHNVPSWQWAHWLLLVSVNTKSCQLQYSFVKLSLFKSYL